MRKRLDRGSNALCARSCRLVRLSSVVGLAGAILVHSGCATTSPLGWIQNGLKVGPNYCRSPAPVADRWIGAEDPRVDQSTAVDGGWWNAFRDPTLNSLVDRAYRQNPTIRLVGTRVLQARAQQAISVGSIFPQGQQAVGSYPHGTFAGNSTYLNLTAFGIAWEADLWGKYRRQIESANAELDASVEDYDAAMVTLLADVATNYVLYRIAQQRLQIVRSNLETQQRLVEIVERQQNVGTATELDVHQLRTLMERTASSIPRLEIVRGQANDRLSILLGEPPHELESELGAGLEYTLPPLPNVPTSVAVGIPVDLLHRRPDVRGAERRIAAQSALIGVAESELYPSLSVSALLGQADFKLSPLGMNGATSVIAPQFSWKILNYGRLLNNVRLQEAKTQELVAAYQSQVLTAAQETQTALRGFLRSQEEAQHLAQSAASAVAASSVGEQLFADVKADVNRLFTLENSQLQVQDQLAIAKGDVALNLINIYRALGGGWEIRLGDNGNAGIVTLPAIPEVTPVAEPTPANDAQDARQ